MAASVVCEEMTNEAQRHITKSHEPRYIISTLKGHLYLAPSPCPRLFQKKKNKEKLLRKHNCTSNPHHHSRFLQVLAQEKRKRGKTSEKFGINNQFKIFFKNLAFCCVQYPVPARNALFQK